MRQSLPDDSPPDTRVPRLAFLALGSLAFWLFPALSFAAPAITYVQGNSATPQSPQTSVSVTFTSAQAAGDLNVIAVGWNDSTATVSSVTDQSGNSYTLAVGPTVQSGVASQSIYYAKSIVAAAAGANIVTVTFSEAATYPDIRILEYRGADPNNPVDVTSAASGNSAGSSSGSATTTNATDLIFGANLVQTTTTGPGGGFTTRLLTSPDGDIAEDQMVTATGSYSATAPVSPSNPWIMQMVAFRTPSGGPTAPTVTSVSPNTGSTAGGTAVTITGTNFALGATVTFGTAAATSVVVASSTSITAVTPAGTGAATVTVTVSGQSGSLTNGFTYVATPTVTSVSPNTGSSAGGTAVTITGTNFATGATVTFGTAAATSVVVASSTSISALTPAGTGAATVTVTVSGQSGSLTNGFTYAAPPTVTSVSPNTGSTAGGTAVTITGTNFATGATVTFGTAAATSVVVASGTSITALTPAGTGAVTVTVTVGGQSGSLTNGFTYAAPPTVTSVSPNTGSTAGGTAVTITGTNFATGATVTFGTAAATSVVVASSTSITAVTPAGTGAVTVTVTVGGQSGSLTSGFTYVASSTTITYVQGNSATPQTNQTSVPVTFTAAQAAGDLNVIAVGWNDSTATVSTITDTSGNTYTRAAGPTVLSGVASQSIYYAKNIMAAAAGANIVTVTFSAAATYPDIRILEYRGADPTNPVDVTSAASGNSAGSSSGSATTTNATDLIFGANLVQTTTTGPGGGFTTRLLTSPDGDIVEDQMVTATGSYSATAPVSPSNPWIMQMVAFRTSGTCPNAPPTTPSSLAASAVSASQINLSWNASTSCYGIAHYVVQRCQGANCTTFATIGTPTATTYSDTGLSSNTSYSYQVQAVDTDGNSSAFSSQASATTVSITITPRVTSLTFTRTQQFTSSGGANVVWSVDGVVGGSSSTGTITSTGMYTPPSAVGTHAVTATISNPTQSVSATVYVVNYPGTFTRDVDNMRTGLNPNETVLTPANVNAATFGKLFSYSIDGVADASPLYVANLNIPAQGYHNVVYVATEHDSVFAFDADALQSTPLWQVSFINPAAGVTTVPDTDVGATGCTPQCNISPEIGITGSPVIDPTTNTLYVVALTKEVSNGNTHYYHRLHALDITTGAEKFGGPVLLQASVPGTGAGSSGGQLPFVSLVENQRPALLLSNGIVYIAFAAHSDQIPYHGWVLGYSASTLQQTLVFNTSPNATSFGAGIWMSGDGLATDTSGNLFFVTGNGIFDVNTGGVDYGDTLLRINQTTGAVLQYFTPADQSNDNANDIDLGSGGVILLPDQAGSTAHPHLALTAGKDGTVYLVDRDSMGGYNANNNGQIVQSVVNEFPNGTNTTGNFKAPVYWNGNLYYSADADHIKSFSIANAQMSTAPTAKSSYVLNYPGGTLEVSANGTTNPILWAIQRVDLDPTGSGTMGPGSLHALDATNVANELYNSNQASGGRDKLDYTCKWSAPLVANGKVYVASESLLSIFGLLP
jgi:IPT/TIG domain/Fibronectin type III domain